MSFMRHLMGCDPCKVKNNIISQLKMEIKTKDDTIRRQHEELVNARQEISELREQVQKKDKELLPKSLQVPKQYVESSNVDKPEVPPDSSNDASTSKESPVTRIRSRSPTLAADVNQQPFKHTTGKLNLKFLPRN